MCAIAVCLKKAERIVGQRWTLLIIAGLARGRKRFCELAADLGGVNPRTLSSRLRELESAGIVGRKVCRTIPPWVEYELTEKGKALGETLFELERWAETWL